MATSKSPDKVGSDPVGADIIDCIELPILVINRDHTIASFNPAAATLLSLLPSDVGQPLRKIQMLKEVSDLEALCEHVMRGGASCHREVRNGAGSWFSLGIGPYRRSDREIRGAVLTLTNVTAFRASLEQAIVEREHTKAILNTVIDPLVVLDEEFRVRAANQAFYVMFQASREVIGRVRLYELGKADWDMPRLRKLLDETRFTDGPLEVLEVDHEFPSIGRRTLLLNARRLPRGNHLEKLTLVAIQDITERKQAENAVLQRTAQFETLLNEAPVGVYLVDGDFRIRQVNPTALLVFGEIPDLIGRDFDEVLHILWPKAYADELVERFRHTLESGEPYMVPEWIEKRLDRGVTEFYEWQIHRIPLPEGRYGVVCYFRDISAPVKARLAIAESAEQLRFMAESMPQKIFTAKPNGDIDYFNRQWIEFTGLSFEQIKDWGWTRFIHPDDLEENLRRWKHSIDTGEPFEFEHRFRREDGVYRWHLSRAHAMRDTNGVLRIWIGSNTDVDDMKRAEEALRQKTVEAQEASLIKSRFVSNVSHELRTPLNVILGYSALLAQGLYGALSHEQKGPLSGIQRNANDLLHLVNDILDLARMEGRKLPTRQEPLNLDLLLKEVVAGMKPFLEKKALDVQWLLPEALPLMESDAGKIKQIFTNILSNAIKFTPEGQITIAVRDRPKKNGIEVGIQDTGIGIKPEELAKIFDAFHQADAGMTREFGGVGLGLTIVKELVHLLEGEMTVESEYTKGSTFTLFFPYRIS